MKNFSRAACLAAVALPFTTVSADEIGPLPTHGGCEWHPNKPIGPVVFSENLPDTYVPRDLPVGAVFGVQPRTNIPSDSQYGCAWAPGSPTFTYVETSLRPMYNGQSEPFRGYSTQGKVFETGIPGVGMVMSKRQAFNGYYWVSADGNPLSPMRASRSSVFLAHEWYTSYKRMFPAFVKTGPIAPGVHRINDVVFFETVVQPSVGKVHEVRYSATIIQAQCDITANPVNATPVQLGQWPAASFTGEGHTTDAKDFNITLNNCIDDPEGGVAAAHLRLDGARGSAPVNAPLGVLSLGSEASATGVGIQILRADNSPMPLLTEVDFGQIPTGGNPMVIPLKARYYQTGPNVTRGNANGALSFTVSYK